MRDNATDYLDGKELEGVTHGFTPNESGRTDLHLFWGNATEIIPVRYKRNPAQSWLDWLMHGTSYIFEREKE